VVENTGKTLRADAGQPLTGNPSTFKPVTGSPSTFKPVNMPVPIKIEENAAGQPAAVRDRRRMPVMTIEDRWRIDDEWWRAEPVSRVYYNVLLTSGRRMVLYKDIIKGEWYEQEY
jgi:hypothetical protein